MTESGISDATATLGERLSEVGLRVETAGGTPALMVRTLRRLAEGRPIPADEFEALSRDIEGAGQARDFVRQRAELDENGNLVGYMGLSQREDHPHGFEVDGVPLRAWCAWDTLFLPPILGRSARVTSTDPATGAAIALTSTPDGVSEAHAAGLLVSVVIPEARGADVTVGDIQSTFCDFVHFFSDREAAEHWLGERGVDAELITIAEAVELGRAQFGELWEIVAAGEF